MKKQLLKSLTMLSILIYSSRSLAMHKDNQYIEFEGEKKFLPALIMASTLNNKHPFSITPLFRYDGGQLEAKGDILNLKGQDLEDIKNKNYVYCDYFREQKTRLSDDEFVSVGALIVGTKDEAIGQELHFLSMVSITDNFEKFKEN